MEITALKIVIEAQYSCTSSIRLWTGVFYTSLF